MMRMMVLLYNLRAWTEELDLEYFHEFDEIDLI